MTFNKPDRIAAYLRQKGYDSRTLQAETSGLGHIVAPITYSQARALAAHFEAGHVEGKLHYNTTPEGDDLRVVIRMSRVKINLL